VPGAPALLRVGSLAGFCSASFFVLAVERKLFCALSRVQTAAGWNPTIHLISLRFLNLWQLFREIWKRSFSCECA
jgi:hypothetical protein